MRKTGLGFMLAIISVSACSAPAPTSPSAAAPTTAASPVASAVQNSDPPASGLAGKARICEISGLRWGRELQINPTMTVSNDGFCGTNVHHSKLRGMRMEVETQPSHGQINIAGDESAAPGFRYHPAAGFVGTDSFVLLTGVVGHEVYANFSVTVTQ